jgi:hypothetical protein
MDIEKYLLDGEEIKKEVHVENGGIQNADWDWYVTSERIIKHGSGFLAKEEFHDISLGKVSGISFESGRENALLGFGLILGALFIILGTLPSEAFLELPIPSDVLRITNLALAAFFGILWYSSKSSYLQIHGHGGSDRWKVDVSGSATESKKVREFAMSLREELSR